MCKCHMDSIIVLWGQPTSGIPTRLTKSGKLPMTFRKVSTAFSSLRKATWITNLPNHLDLDIYMILVTGG